jgi:predicted dehydrogenase
VKANILRVLLVINGSNERGFYNMKKIGIGIIGTGDMGQSHIRALSLLMDKAAVVAVYEPNPERVRAASSDYPEPVVACGSRQELLERNDIDAVFIATPNDQHLDDGLAAMSAGKHVFCEKPIAATMADTKRLVETAHRLGTIFQVGLVYRYSTLFRRMAEIIESGSIGEPRMAWCHEFRVPFPVGRNRDWRYSQMRSGGTLVEKNCHHFDLLNWMIGSDPKRVFASGALDVVKPDGQVVPGVPGEPYQYDGRCEVIDNAWVIVDYANGARASLGLCMFAAERKLPVGVLGTHGWIEAEVISQTLSYRIYTGDKTREENFKDTLIVNGQTIGHPGGLLQVEDFINCIREHRQPFCNGHIALQAMAVSFAAETSIQRQAYVEMDEKEIDCCRFAATYTARG